MANPGSQYVFFAPGQQVNVVLTADGTNLPQGDPSKFNIELVTNPPNGTNFNVAFTQGYQTAVLLPGGTGQTAQLLAGNYGIQDTVGGNAITLLSNGAQTVIGAKGDTITGGSGNDLLNAAAGSQLVLVGSGATTVYGGVGDTIVGAAGTVLIDGSAGGQTISGGNGQSTIIGGPGDVITGTGGNGASTIYGAQNATITAGFGSDLINGTAGKQLIKGSGGSMTVFGGSGDTITAGAGDATIDGSAGNMVITAGSAGTDIIVGSVARPDGTGVNTIFGGAAVVQIQGLGKGDIVNFSGQSGNANINALAGNNLVALGSGFAAVYVGTGDTVSFGSGAQLADAEAGGAIINVGASGSDTIIGSVAKPQGAAGNTINGGGASALIQGLGVGDVVNFANQTGGATINGTVGNVKIALGSGAATVFGGVGDSILMGSGSQYVDGTAGGQTIGVGSGGGNNTIVGSAARGAGVGVDTLTGGAANVLVQGLGAGDILNFAAQSGSAVINATAGNNTITLGSGVASVFSGIGGSITLGTGAQLVSAQDGGTKIAVGGAGGSDTIIGSVNRANGVGVDTLTGGGANVIVSGLGSGDIVNFVAQSGTAAINATAGNNVITLGSGAASVFGGANSTFNLGSGNQYVDAGAAASSLIVLGSAGNANIAGPTTAGGMTIRGGGANLTYNVGIGKDLIDLTGATGSAVINAFGADKAATNDTIIAGNGGTSVFGGAGNRIGVGLGAAGNSQFTHATTIADASIGFGSNDSVVAATYGKAAGDITVNPALNPSTAKVTVTGFSQIKGSPTDYIFYKNEGAGTTAAIVATSSEVNVNGSVGTQFTLPDGTVMTLLGVAKGDFNASFFKA